MKSLFRLFFLSKVVIKKLEKKSIISFWIFEEELMIFYCIQPQKQLNYSCIHQKLFLQYKLEDMDPLTRMSAIKKDHRTENMPNQITTEETQQRQYYYPEETTVEQKQEGQNRVYANDQEEKQDHYQQNREINTQREEYQIVQQQAQKIQEEQFIYQAKNIGLQQIQHQEPFKLGETVQRPNFREGSQLNYWENNGVQNNKEKPRLNMIQISPSEKQFSSIFGQKQQNRQQVAKIKIQINSSQQIGSGLSKSIQYRIQGQDKHGPFLVDRTYSQFESLRGILYERWPGCFIPSINKQNDLKTSQQKDKYIRYILKNFIVGISYSPLVYYREQVQLFLRSPDINIIEMCEQMPPLKTRDVIGLFISNFGEEFQRKKFSNVEQTIRKFIQSLRKISNSLMSIAQRVLGLVNSYEKYAQSISKFGIIQKQYEQSNLTFYASNNLQKTILVKDNDNKIEKLKFLSHHNPFFELYACLNSQSNDAQAFRQIIIASELFLLRKDQLQKQIRELQVQIQDLNQENKKSIRLVASRKTKQQYLSELNARLKKITSQQETMLEMFRMLQGIIITESIPTFKTVKRDTYRKILKQWAIFTTESCCELEQVWAFIYQQSKQYSK